MDLRGFGSALCSVRGGWGYVQLAIQHHDRGLEIDCEHEGVNDDAGNIFAWVYVFRVIFIGGHECGMINEECECVLVFTFDLVEVCFKVSKLQY